METVKHDVTVPTLFWSGITDIYMQYASVDHISCADYKLLRYSTVI